MKPEGRFVPFKEKFDESNVRGCPDSPSPTPQPAQLQPKAPGKEKDQVQARIPGRIKIKVRPKEPAKKIRNLKSLQPVKDFLTTQPRPDYQYLSKTGRCLFDDRYVQKPQQGTLSKLRPQRNRKRTWRAQTPEEAPSQEEPASKKRKIAEKPTSKKAKVAEEPPFEEESSSTGDRSSEERSSTEEPPSEEPKAADSLLPTPPDSPPHKKKEAVDQADDSDYETYCHLATLMYTRLQQH